MSAFTEANRQAFNNLSSEYNSKGWQRKITQTISHAVTEHLDWIGVDWKKPDEKEKRDVRLLDYACGTGLVTKPLMPPRVLGPYVTTITGIDISEKMVALYNEAALSSGLKHEQANAVVGDLCAEKTSPTLSGPAFQDFDIAVISLGFHHFENPPLAAKRLVERLKPEGVLLIIDFLPFDKNEGKVHNHSHGHGQSDNSASQAPPSDTTDAPAQTGQGGIDPMKAMHHTIMHDGFSGEIMRKTFDFAGLDPLSFRFDVIGDPIVLEFEAGTTKRTAFIARGKKPPTA